MSSTYTSRLGLELQADGENSNTWGQRLNSSVITLLDTAIAGLTSVALSSVPITLTKQDGTSDQSRASILYLHGTLTSNCQVVVPSVTKLYSIYNNCAGNFNPIVKTAGAAGSPVPRGALVHVMCDSVSVWIDRTSAGSSAIMSTTTVGTVTSIGVSAGVGVSVTGSPVTGNGSIAILLDIAKLTTDSDPVNTADFVALYSTSAAAPRKTLAEDVGRVLQVVTTVDSAVSTGSTQMVNDDSVPLITEGNEFMTLSITPKHASSMLYIDVNWVGTNSNSVAGTMIVALYVDTSTSALAAVPQRIDANGNIAQIPLAAAVSSNSLTARTYRVRAGFNDTGTTTFNGSGGSRFMGGVMASRMRIMEVLPG
jgi:hypothetical protein